MALETPDWGQYVTYRHVSFALVVPPQLVSQPAILRQPGIQLVVVSAVLTAQINPFRGPVLGQIALTYYDLDGMWSMALSVGPGQLFAQQIMLPGSMASDPMMSPNGAGISYHLEYQAGLPRSACLFTLEYYEVGG